MGGVNFNRDKALTMIDITNSNIIMTSIDDGAWMNSFHGNVDALHEYLRRNYQECSLAKVIIYGLIVKNYLNTLRMVAMIPIRGVNQVANDITHSGGNNSIYFTH